MNGKPGSRAESDFLAGMAAHSHRRLRQAQARRCEKDLLAGLQACPPALPLQLSGPGFDIIAEIKKQSPSAGSLADAAMSPVRQAGGYFSGGAAALSVLTEPTAFGGGLDDLEQVSALRPAVPVMRKDFLVDRYQVLEARMAGASGVLLIAAMLDDKTLFDMLRSALELGMFVLMEAFDSRDIERCASLMSRAGAVFEEGRCRMLLGLNCRDLRTLEVNFSRFTGLAAELPAEMPWVAESGVTSKEQVALLAAAGYRLALVGTSLMRAPDPAATLQELIAAGRRAVAAR